MPCRLSALIQPSSALSIDVVPSLFLWDLDLMERVNFANQICLQLLQWSNFLSCCVVYYDVSLSVLSFSFHKRVLVLEQSEAAKFTWSNVVVKELLGFLQKIVPSAFFGKNFLINCWTSTANMETARNLFISDISKSRTNANSLLSPAINVRQDFT